MADIFGGARQVNTLNGMTAVRANFPQELNGARVALLPATVGSWQPALSISGIGRLNFAAIRATASSSIGIRVTVDGRLLDTIGPISFSGAGTGIAIVGSWVTSYTTIGGDFGSAIFQPVDFQSSLLIETQYPVTNTSAQLWTNYETDL